MDACLQRVVRPQALIIGAQGILLITLLGVDTRTQVSTTMVWAATTTTFNPGSIAREAPAFVDLIIGQLASRNIIARQ